MPNGLFGYEKTDSKVCSRRKYKTKKGLNKYLCARKEEINLYLQSETGEDKRFRAWSRCRRYK